jgi:hypothetical protein
MIMFVSEYAEPEIVSIGNEDPVILADKSFGVKGPSGHSSRIRRVFEDCAGFGVKRKCGSDVISELFLI